MSPIRSGSATRIVSCKAGRSDRDRPALAVRNTHIARRACGGLARVGRSAATATVMHRGAGRRHFGRVELPSWFVSIRSKRAPARAWRRRGSGCDHAVATAVHRPERRRCRHRAWPPHRSARRGAFVGRDGAVMIGIHRVEARLRLRDHSARVTVPSPLASARINAAVRTRGGIGGGSGGLWPRSAPSQPLPQPAGAAAIIEIRAVRIVLVSRGGANPARRCALSISSVARSCRPRGFVSQTVAAAQCCAAALACAFCARACLAYGGAWRGTARRGRRAWRDPCRRNDRPPRRRRRHRAGTLGQSGWAEAIISGMAIKASLRIVHSPHRRAAI